ncbi:hypothetical protein OWR29_39840 [Actinoplanes sp. Pm04-4]|uniref:Uncharacterized protein n=1 Tax=Paractinoplanes pyxinae TaxID=2997416 RepID=A0ABT4BCG8_9ACTN|nr:hypothetical protein [Actinoplanes pyxinae]MCY1144182.1 hypothetical protein [Actinoplanes pyxinae]
MATYAVRKVWIGYSAIGIVLTVVRTIVPEGSLGAGLVTYCYPVLTVAAIGLGVRFHRPAWTLPWILLLVMSVAGGAGNMVMCAVCSRLLQGHS